MASTLTVNIAESITLENGNQMNTFNTVSIPNISQIVRRIDTIVATFSGSGIEILKFVDSEAQQTAGSFVKSDVKYLRFTNISPTGSAEIYLISTGNESSIFTLDAGKSLMFGNSEFNATSTNDYVVEGYVDETYYSDFVYYDTIKAKSLASSSIKLEYVVASL
jgi:hypothetical protein